MTKTGGHFRNGIIGYLKIRVGVWVNQRPHFPLTPTPTYFPLPSATSAPYMTLALLPAGGEWKVAGRALALALAESGDVNLPTP